MHDEIAAPTGRQIARIDGARGGPTLVVVAGIHGNEHGGVTAVRRVFDTLAAHGSEVRGRVVALAGNVGALAVRRRFLGRDLNRMWTSSDLRAAHAGAEDVPERVELAELHDAIEHEVRGHRRTAFLLDLHTTSAAGVPFALFGDAMRQRSFAFELPIPLVLGLEEQIDGVLAEYWSRRGVSSISVEGGQHDDPASVDNLVAVLWVMLESSGVLRRDALPDIAAARAHLEACRSDLPSVVEVLRRHAITDEDRFVMEPGFRNLDYARSGQRLARDRRGEVTAPDDGMVILPLYQSQGGEGFFWGRAVSPARLRVSALLREGRIERLLPWLPGVRAHPSERDLLVIDTRVARLYPLQVFHLFGYRKVRRDGRWLTVARPPE